MKNNNNNMKFQKNILAISMIAILAVVFYFGFTTFASADDTKSKYVIENNEESIELGVESYLNSSEKENLVDIKVENTLDLDNKKFLLFTVNNEIGFAEISTGENGLLGVDYASFGSDPVKVNVTSSNGERYIVAFGKNYNEKIKELKITADNEEIKLGVPDHEYFITYDKLNTTIPADASATVDMYDNYGREITVDMYLEHYNKSDI